MENNNKQNEVFNYTYSAQRQDKIKKIRSRYLPKTEDKMATLVRLDKRVTARATVAALVPGIIGLLTFGVGLCCVLVWSLLTLGIILGILGAAIMIPAYPLYIYVDKKERERVAPEILRLSDELLK